MKERDPYDGTNNLPVMYKDKKYPCNNVFDGDNSDVEIFFDKGLIECGKLVGHEEPYINYQGKMYPEGFVLVELPSGEVVGVHKSHVRPRWAS